MESAGSFDGTLSQFRIGSFGPFDKERIDGLANQFCHGNASFCGD
jgi:hypothetical protein